MALRFTRAVVNLQIPVGTIGAYLLLQYEQQQAAPLYVGRSDTCLRQRLIRHPLRSRATHFIAAPTRDSHYAYAIESYWYHRYLSTSATIANLIHPASPAGTGRRCPYCHETEIERALRRALPPPHTL
ncbi:hypothetical protein ACIQXD_22830 [Streptomyces uncialis]|uniref:hypothetical protein n=1 Tax=Streptomyces uncialis TaxID=1048205 RepID=UPI0038151BFE